MKSATDTVTVPAASLDMKEAMTAAAYVDDAAAEAVLRRCFTDLGIADGEIVKGGMPMALLAFANRPSPRLLVVDISNVSDPLLELPRLADVCDPTTSVVAIGDRNDIVLYRDLKAAGVAEYFFKPLVGTLVERACQEILTGEMNKQTYARKGKLILIAGVRGGVGATTIAVTAAWHLAAEHKRRTLLIDLDLQNGDAALISGVQPSHALTEALQFPDRVDDLFLERAVIRVTERFALLASLEPLSKPVIRNEDAVRHLIDRLLPRYRYVFVDLPITAVNDVLPLLDAQSSLLLVTDGSLSAARDIRRWSELIGPSTPQRQILHVLNRQGAKGCLPPAEFAQAAGAPPQVVIPFDRKAAADSLLGVTGLVQCKSLMNGMSQLLRLLVGDSIKEERSLMQRILAP